MISASNIKKGIAVVIIGVMVTAFILMQSDLRSIVYALKNMNYSIVPLILAIIPINYCIRYLRYHYYLHLVKVKVSFKDELLSLLSSFVMVVTPAKLGEMLMRGYILKQKNYDIPMLTVCALTLADRLTEGIAMSTLTIISLVLIGSGHGFWAVVVVFTILLTASFILQRKELLNKILNVTVKIKWLSKTATHFKEAYDQAYPIFRFAPLLLSISMGICAWLCEAAVIFLSVKAFGSYIRYEQAIFVVSFTGIVGALSMVPGEVIVADGTMLGLLLWLGADKTAAGTVTIISRFSTMWLGVLLGCIFILLDRSVIFNTMKEKKDDTNESADRSESA